MKYYITVQANRSDTHGVWDSGSCRYYPIFFGNYYTTWKLVSMWSEIIKDPSALCLTFKQQSEAIFTPTQFQSTSLDWTTAAALKTQRQIIYPSLTQRDKTRLAFFGWRLLTQLASTASYLLGARCASATQHTVPSGWTIKLSTCGSARV